MLLSRTFHKIFLVFPTTTTYQESPTKGKEKRKTKTRLLLLLPSSFQDSWGNLPNLSGWRPINSWETLGISCPSILQCMAEIGKENCLFLTLLPPLPCPQDPWGCHTPFPSMPTLTPRPYAVISVKEWKWEGRNRPLTSLPCLVPQGQGLSSPKLGSNTRYNF